MNADSEPTRTRGQRARYNRYYIWIHQQSTVNRDDLSSELKKMLEDRAYAAGEMFTLKANRGKQPVYVIGPKGAGRQTPQERAKKKLAAAIDQAREAGLDIRPFVD